MDGEYSAILNEIHEVLKSLADGQAQLLETIRELREEQKKLYNEIRTYNSAINNIPIRTEIIN